MIKVITWFVMVRYVHERLENYVFSSLYLHINRETVH